MCEELSYQLINASVVNQVVFCNYLKFVKIIIEKKTLALTVARNAEMYFLNSFKRNLASLFRLL